MEAQTRQSCLLMAVFALAAILALSLLVFCCATDQQAQRDQAAPRTEETKATPKTQAPEQKEDGSPEGRVVYNPADVDEEPVFFDTQSPQYPESAKINGATATVILTLVVNEKGRVEDVQVLLYKGGGEFKEKFIEEAISAARRCTFAPATKAGKPVPCMAKIRYEFRLE